MFYQSLQHVRCWVVSVGHAEEACVGGERERKGDRPMRRQRWSESTCSKEGGSEISSDSDSIRP